MDILITGTSSGVGFGLANHYLEEGHTVYGISRKRSNALEKFKNFKFLQQDISDFSALETSLKQFLNGVEILDLVVLNAGVLNEIKDLSQTGLDEIKQAMDTNVWANKVLIDQLFASTPRVLKVVAISSGASTSGARGWNVYALSKATLNMLVKLYANEHPQTHFTALAPGLVDSNMQDYIYSLQEQEKFPIIKKLRAAKGTAQMPKPKAAAKKIAAVIEDLERFPSGSFQDVRKL